MKKILTLLIFGTAIAAGLGVGYGTLRVSTIAYGAAVAYVSEVTTSLTFETISQGGPAVDQSVIQSELNVAPKADEGAFSILKADKVPKISAASFLVADVKTGKVLASKNINQQMPIASITKLMTAIVADEFLGLDYKTTVGQQAIDTYGTQGDLRRGETYYVSELLYPLLLESSNDAGEALAYAKDRPAFIAAMNEKAQSIGLVNTIYDDASGLSSHNVSSVTDLFRLTQYIHTYRKYIFDITVQNTFEIGNKKWFNNSRFRNDRDYTGGKNGFTDAAQKTQVVLFSEDFDGVSREIAYIVLRSDDVAYDVKLLRNFVSKYVEYK